MQSAEFRVQGAGCRVQSIGWRVQGGGWRVECLEGFVEVVLEVDVEHEGHLRLRVWGLEFRGLGFQV